MPRRFRLAYVPGVMPAKWARKWEERFPDVPLELASCTVAGSAALLKDDGADAVVTRLPRALDVGRAVASAQATAAEAGCLEHERPA